MIYLISSKVVFGALVMKVFLSYTEQDRSQVEEFYTELKYRGFDPWMDIHDLLPGMAWDNVIQHNMSASDVCIIFISEKSKEKIGYVQKELNYFVDKLSEMPENYIYCIPIVLDNSTAPNSLSKKIQYIKLDSPKHENWRKVLSSLNLAASQRNIRLKNNENDDLKIEIKYDYEMYNAVFGYQFTFSYPFFESNSKKNLAVELNRFIDSKVMSAKIDSRVIIEDDQKNILDNDIIYTSYIESKDDLEGKIISYDDAQVLRLNNNLYSIVCDIEYLDSYFISLAFYTDSYGSGAAHGNSHTETVNFRIIDSKLFKVHFSDFFDQKIIGLKAINDFLCQAIIQEITYKKFLLNKELVNDETWLHEGVKAASEEDFVGIFNINNKGWLFHFDPYMVDAYAAGKYEVLIPHIALYEWYKPEFKKIFM